MVEEKVVSTNNFTCLLCSCLEGVSSSGQDYRGIASHQERHHVALLACIVNWFVPSVCEQCVESKLVSLIPPAPRSLTRYICVLPALPIQRPIRVPTTFNSVTLTTPSCTSQKQCRPQSSLSSSRLSASQVPSAPAQTRTFDQ